MEPGGSGPITGLVVVALAIISFLLFNVVSNSSLGRKMCRAKVTSEFRAVPPLLLHVHLV